MGNNKSPFRARQEPAQEKYTHRVRVLCNSSPAVSAYDIFWKGAAGSYLDTFCRLCLPVVYQPQVYEPQADKINLYNLSGTRHKYIEPAQLFGWTGFNLPARSLLGRAAAEDAPPPRDTARADTGRTGPQSPLR